MAKVGWQWLEDKASRIFGMTADGSKNVTFSNDVSVEGGLTVTGITGSGDVTFGGDGDITIFPSTAGKNLYLNAAVGIYLGSAGVDNIYIGRTDADRTTALRGILSVRAHAADSATAFTVYDTDNNPLFNVDGTADTVTVTGAIAVTSTVDGRDVAADGTKLDGIEALADVTDWTNVAAALAAATGDVNVNTQKITNVVDPAAAQDAATKNYVDTTALLLAGGVMTGDIQLALTGKVRFGANGSYYTNTDARLGDDTLIFTWDNNGINMAAAKFYHVDSTQVVGTQGAAVADATDAASAITQLNLWLARARAHGLIAT